MKDRILSATFQLVMFILIALAIIFRRLHNRS
jgi:uncharacterized membrane protein YhaH (DUF805 family)